MRAPWLIQGLGVVALGALCWTGNASPEEGTANVATLSHKAHKKWGLNVPAETWIPIDWSISLHDGLEFTVEQTGPMKLAVDTNGDGKTNGEVKGKGGSVTLKGTNDSGEKVSYTVRLKPQGKTWVWTVGSTQTGTVEGVKVSLIDMNGNGRFDDFGADAYTIGKSRNAAYLSKVVNIKGALFNFQPNASGTSVTTSPYTGETATLDVKSKFKAKAKLVNAVFTDGNLSFNIADAKKGGMLVPSGNYSFKHGYVTKGSSHATMKGGTMEKLKLESGATQILEWGAPIAGEFSFAQDGTKVTVQPNFKFFGNLGEEYQDFQPKGGGPKILVKEDGKGTVLAKGRFGST